MNDKILLIGCGNLGKLLSFIWIEKNYNISILEKNLNLRQNIKKKFPKTILYESLSDLELNQFNIIILCIKPDDSLKVLKSLSNNITSKQIIISLVAGLKIKVINQILGKKNNIFRVMPNIFVSVKSSSTAIYTEKNTGNSLKSKSKIDKLFSNFGKNIWLKKEEEMNFFTALFGGGPAYFFFFLSILTEISIEKGIKPNIAFDLVTNLLKGTFEYLNVNGDDLSFQISKVTSKGGTTEEAVNFLKNKNRLYKLILSSLSKAEKKSKKISSSLMVK